MRAEVAHIDHVVEPGRQVAGLPPIARRNGLLVRSQHSLEHLRQRTEGHDLCGHPDRQVRELRIRRAVMRDEQLTGAYRSTLVRVGPGRRSTPGD